MENVSQVQRTMYVLWLVESWFNVIPKWPTSGARCSDCSIVSVTRGIYQPYSIKIHITIV